MTTAVESAGTETIRHRAAPVKEIPGLSHMNWSQTTIAIPSAASLPDTANLFVSEYDVSKLLLERCPLSRNYDRWVSELGGIYDDQDFIL